MFSPGFHPEFAIAGLAPAEYNPRVIDDASFAELRRSVRTHGVIRPIIATAAGVIVAGHQRTKACRAEGITSAPVFVIPAVVEGDEARFNQLHNATDVEHAAEVRVPPAPQGWRDVPAADIVGDPQQPGGPVRHEIFRLLNRYGLWGGAVARADGVVVVGAQYALTCALARRPCRTYYLPPEAGDTDLLVREYGHFHYAALKRTPWHQTFCQPQRNGGQLANSPLYEGFVMPGLTRTERLVDVGCGTGAYIRRLRAAGYKATGWEPYWRKGTEIDRGAARKLTEELFAEYEKNGPFDVGVADTVVNATGSVDSARDVALLLTALVKPGGRVYVSGISREGADREAASGRYATKMARLRRVHFHDPSGLTAIHYRGEWFYQWAATQEQVTAFSGSIGKVTRAKAAGYWWLELTNDRPASREDVLAAVRREFELPYPDGGTLGMGDRAVEVLGGNYRPCD